MSEPIWPMHGDEDDPADSQPESKPPPIPEDLEYEYGLAKRHPTDKWASCEVVPLIERIARAEATLTQVREDRDAFAQSFKDRSELLAEANKSLTQAREALLKAKECAIDGKQFTCIGYIDAALAATQPLTQRRR